MFMFTIFVYVYEFTGLVQWCIPVNSAGSVLKLKLKPQF